MPPIDITRGDGVRYDVVAIGNALVDVIAAVPDEFLVNEDVVKGSMTLVDSTRSAHLYSRISTQHKPAVVLRPTPHTALQVWVGEQASSAKSPTTTWAACLVQTWTKLVLGFIPAQRAQPNQLADASLRLRRTGSAA